VTNPFLEGVIEEPHRNPLLEGVIEEPHSFCCSLLVRPAQHLGTRLMAKAMLSLAEFLFMLG
jgi:hypothetical protein